MTEAPSEPVSSPDPAPAEGPPRLFCFGLGYVARALCRELRAIGFRVAGTSRTPAKIPILERDGIEAHLFDGARPIEDAERALAGTTHLLVSVPPGEGGDVVLLRHREHLASLDRLAWAGYISSTGVYGDHDGGWVDETTEPRPGNARAVARLEAERLWLAFARTNRWALAVFRVAAIYGPGRSALNRLRAGLAQRIQAPGHVGSRAHLDDIVGTLRASIDQPRAFKVYNVADDQPAAPEDLITFAAELLGVDPPSPVRLDDPRVSDGVRRFFRDRRRVSNRRIKEDLGVVLRHPSYRDGLRAIYEAERETLR